MHLAVEAGLAGDPSSASDHLQRVAVRDNVLHDQQLLALAKALTELQSAPRAERRERFAALREQMPPHFGAWRMIHSMRDIRRTFRRTGELFHREGAGPGAWLWFKWKLHWQWSLLPLAPMALAVAVQPPVLLALLLWRLTRQRRGE